MLSITKWLLLGVALCVSTSSMALPAIEKPIIMLPMSYQRGYQQIDDIRRYWISEKLDGVRARWNGQHLVSRGGQIFAAPTWFTVNFPTMPLDGELWLARGRFADTLSIVRQHQADDRWQHIKFMLFDLPSHAGTFDQRLKALQAIVKLAQIPYLQAIKQFRLDDTAQLMDHLQTISQQGAEGLMLHAQDGYYHSGRSADLLKLKINTEAYAQVIGYRAGKGKFTGLVGSLKVRAEGGKTFHLGSGLNLKDRQNPPAIGSLVQFRYQGLTKNGIPRFAVFLRLRDSIEQEQ